MTGGKKIANFCLGSKRRMEILVDLGGEYDFSIIVLYFYFILHFGGSSMLRTVSIRFKRFDKEIFGERLGERT